MQRRTDKIIIEIIADWLYNDTLDPQNSRIDDLWNVVDKWKISDITVNSSYDEIVKQFSLYTFETLDRMFYDFCKANHENYNEIINMYQL